MISCDEYQKKMVAVLDNEGSDEDERLLSAHLADCPECRAFYDGMVSTRQLFSIATATKGTTTIRNAQCVHISFPHFFDVLEQSTIR